MPSHPPYPFDKVPMRTMQIILLTIVALTLVPLYLWFEWDTAAQTRQLIKDAPEAIRQAEQRDRENAAFQQKMDREVREIHQDYLRSRSR